MAAGKKVSLPGIKIGGVLPLLMCYDANRDISFQSRQLNPTECFRQTWAVLQWKGQLSLLTNSLDYGHAYRVSSTCSISVEPSGELSQNILHYLLPLAKKTVMMDVSNSTFIASNFCSILPMYNVAIILARYPISKGGQIMHTTLLLGPPPRIFRPSYGPAYLCLQTCQNNIFEAPFRTLMQFSWPEMRMK